MKMAEYGAEKHKFASNSNIENICIAPLIITGNPKFSNVHLLRGNKPPKGYDIIRSALFDRTLQPLIAELKKYKLNDDMIRTLFDADFNKVKNGGLAFPDGRVPEHIRIRMSIYQMAIDAFAHRDFITEKNQVKKNDDKCTMLYWPADNRATKARVWIYETEKDGKVSFKTSLLTDVPRSRLCDFISNKNRTCPVNYLKGSKNGTAYMIAEDFRQHLGPIWMPGAHQFQTAEPEECTDPEPETNSELAVKETEDVVIEEDPMPVDEEMFEELVEEEPHAGTEPEIVEENVHEAEQIAKEEDELEQFVEEQTDYDEIDNDGTLAPRPKQDRQASLVKSTHFESFSEPPSPSTPQRFTGWREPEYHIFRELDELHEDPPMVLSKTKDFVEPITNSILKDKIDRLIECYPGFTKNEVNKILNQHKDDFIMAFTHMANLNE